ncbi:MAG TPA: hypothetical protein VFC63_19250, partial [Blastocatellia bacterium]|nr:hypothetical protein [Blastocatellia bacterium]
MAAFSGTTPPPQQQQSQPTSLSGLLGKVAGFLGVQKFGQGIASAARISTGQDNQERNENDRALQQNAQLISLLHNPKTTPAQKQHILSFMKLISSGEDTLPTEAQIDPGTGLSNKQVIGSALSTAALAAGGGVGADAAADAVTGGIAKGAVGGAVAGAETGAAVGAGSALQNNGSPVDVIKGAVKTGAFGAAGGGLLGGAVGGISDIVAGAGNTIRRVLSPASNLDADAQTAIDSFSTKLSP